MFGYGIILAGKPLSHVTVRRNILRLAAPLLLLARASSQGQVPTTNFFNWETAPVHPVAISPDGTKLVVCNLPDDRLEVFDITSGKPVALTNVPVGLDPVTVRFRPTGSVQEL